MGHAIPAGVLRLARAAVDKYALLILLDGYPYVELHAAKKADFAADLARWKIKTYPTLLLSRIRYFTLLPDGKITEKTFE